MILVVDDDPTFLEQAQKALNRDRQVVMASDSKQAWRLAQRLGFSVMLVDLNLQGEDGLDLIERMHSAFPDVPIIAISDGLSKQVELMKLQAHGAVAVLLKPITAEWQQVVERFRAMRWNN
jgi:CheY-like chemotaxis protein